MNKRQKKIEEKEPSNSHMHVYVNDASAVIEKAGGTAVMPITEDESGKMGGFVDPFNNLWWIKSLNE
ncbi:hypothetical protein [Peribacillus simplex]|uniref:hypothetical protein n=1 Tax=Peribacillus simplex TaxID=1478 RepID=UPI003D2A0F4F